MIMNPFPYLGWMATRLGSRRWQSGLLLALVLLFTGCTATGSVATAPEVTPDEETAPSPEAPTLWTAYTQALQDAAVYRHSHLRPLRPLVATREAPTAQVVTLTAADHRPPSEPEELPECPRRGSRVDGSESPQLPDEGYECRLNGEVWVTVVPEVQETCRTFSGEVELRLRQLLGLPPDHPIAHFVEMTVAVADVFRPAPDPDPFTEWPCKDPEEATCGNAFPPDVSADHVKWYGHNTLISYRIPGGFPWTHLGYTYNWRPGGDRYGASEYVVRKGSRVVIRRIVGYEEYCRGGARIESE